MITVRVCINCQSKTCCDYKDGIGLYEFLKEYITEYFQEDIEIKLEQCKCTGICKGPVIKVNNRVYTNVDKRQALQILKDIILNKGGINNDKRNT